MMLQGTEFELNLENQSDLYNVFLCLPGNESTKTSSYSVTLWH